MFTHFVFLLSVEQPTVQILLNLHNFESFAYLLMTTAEQMSVAGFHTKRRVNENIMHSLRKVKKNFKLKTC